MSSKKMVALTVAVGLLAVWWMVGRQPAPEQPAAAAPAPSTVQPSTVTVPAVPAPTSGRPTPTAPAVTTEGLSGKERAEVAAFAARFMEAFARPGKRVSARSWWQRVASMLTDDAVDLYSGITPAQVGYTKVTGPAELQPVDPASDAFWIQPVDVPTDGGRYTLLIQLPSAGFATTLGVLEIQEP